jgi:hypothetical protein
MHGGVPKGAEHEQYLGHDNLLQGHPLPSHAGQSPRVSSSTHNNETRFLLAYKYDMYDLRDVPVFFTFNRSFQ